MPAVPRPQRVARPFLVLAGLLSVPTSTFGWGGTTIRPAAIAYNNSFHKDAVMDAPWRVQNAETAIPLTIVLKDCDTDNIQKLQRIRCWDVTQGSTILWNHDFNDEQIGNNATEADYWTYITTVTEGHPSLPNGTLLTPANLGYAAGAVIRLKITISYNDNFLDFTATRYLRVQVGGGRFPWPEGWYGGDLHYHTMYTNNVAEFGAPLPAVRATAIALGLDWLVTTDHSCDLDEIGDGDLSYATPQWEYTLQSPAGIQTFTRDNRTYGSTWGALAVDIADFQDESFRLVRGEEVNLGSIDPASQDKTLHALFVNAEYVHSPRSGAAGERPVSTSVPAGLDQLSPQGFVFAAHPTSDLGQELGGIDYAVNGAPWGDADFAYAITTEGFIGFEGFNTRHTRRSEAVGDCPSLFDCVTNPWPDFDAGPDGPYPAKVLREVALWETFLRSNLDIQVQSTSGSGPRKIFFAGGSDAHGDFNYGTHLGNPVYATDNAIGKVQTVAWVPGPYGPGNAPPAAEILNAVRAGRTVVTDGPFLEIGIDRDGDGSWYGASDLRLGDAGQVVGGTSLPLHLRWASLPEFGPVTSLRVWVGNSTATTLLYESDPSAEDQGYEGATSLDLRAVEVEGTVYVRAECVTSDGDAGHRAFTNPIWIQFAPTPVVVEDLAASMVDGAVHLTWRLTRASLGELHGVHVQRGAASPGPYEDCRAAPLAPQLEMSHVDANVTPGRTYWYRLVLQGQDGAESTAGPIAILVGTGPASTTLAPPRVASSGQAAEIRYRIAGPASRVQLWIYGPDGHLVCALARAVEAPGEHVHYWDLRNDAGAPVGRGVYFVRLEVGGQVLSQKLVKLVR